MKIKEKIKKFVDNPIFLKILKFICVLSFGVIIGVLSMCDCKKVSADASFDTVLYNPFANANVIFYDGGTSDYVGKFYNLPLSNDTNQLTIGYGGDYFNIDPITNAYSIYWDSPVGVTPYILMEYSYNDLFCVYNFDDINYFAFSSTTEENFTFIVTITFDYYNGVMWRTYDEYFYVTHNNALLNKEIVVEPCNVFQQDYYIFRNFNIVMGLEVEPLTRGLYEFAWYIPNMPIVYSEYMALNNSLNDFFQESPPMENVLATLFSNVNDFLAIEVLPGVTFLGLLGICIAIPLTLMVLKIWLGG